MENKEICGKMCYMLNNALLQRGIQMKEEGTYYPARDGEGLRRLYDGKHHAGIYQKAPADSRRTFGKGTATGTYIALFG